MKACPGWSKWPNCDIVWFMLSRRMILWAPLAESVIAAAAAANRMILCLHQNTSAGAGFRKSLEGWAKAGITNVELNDRLLAEFLKTYPKRNVLIEGHSDSLGNEEFNLKLSQQRADAVRDLLVARGITSQRIRTKGYGARFPIVP